MQRYSVLCTFTEPIMSFPASSDHAESETWQIMNLTTIESHNCPFSPWLTWQLSAKKNKKKTSGSHGNKGINWKRQSKITTGTWPTWPKFGLLCLSGEIQEGCVSPCGKISLYRGQPHRDLVISYCFHMCHSYQWKWPDDKRQNLPVSIMEFALCYSRRGNSDDKFGVWN